MGRFIKRNLGKIVLGIAAVLLIAYSVQQSVIRQQPIPEGSAYVGSAACLECHQSEHSSWADSLHPKMMRSVSADIIAADFQAPNSPTSFDLSDVEWVIGSKWEQQFMGHDGSTETLLPAVWEVGNQRWKTSGWDGWKAPEPLRRCHGCHTVGLDLATGEFVEPGIGCESCHGPGEWHVSTGGNGKITSIVDAEVCGQCHSRGRSVDHTAFFPIGYKPGDELAESFNDHYSDLIQNSSTWWGNGRERKRHQEYTAWRQGGHADALNSLTENYDGRYGPVKSECLTCHAGEAAIVGKGHGLGIDDVEQGITCSVCHYVHGELEQERVACDQCHGEGPFHHQTVSREDHIPCPVEAEVQCIDCHMPLTGRNGGAYTLHSHHPGIVQPQDTEQFGVPNSCANGGCHSDAETLWLQSEFEEFYGEIN